MADGSSSRSSPSTRRASKIALTIVAAVVVWNGQRIAIAGIHGYQHSLSPIASAVGIRCRFTPTCSRYAEVVIARDGILKGGIKSLARIARCNPLTPFGTRDDP
ncbi:MAG TPA: membrane protein insertion efficiency factor YidD [Vicinamibacterales bacterium]|nr:membrane protein insertion efficiency factor YidD [Vicinamibacterales bacterium]